MMQRRGCDADSDGDERARISYDDGKIQLIAPAPAVRVDMRRKNADHPP